MSFPLLLFRGPPKSAGNISEKVRLPAHPVPGVPGGVDRELRGPRVELAPSLEDPACVRLELRRGAPRIERELAVSTPKAPFDHAVAALADAVAPALVRRRPGIPK